MIVMKIIDGIVTLAKLGINAVAKGIARLGRPVEPPPSLEAADPVELNTPAFEQDDSIFVSRIRKRIRRRPHEAG